MNILFDSSSMLDQIFIITGLIGTFALVLRAVLLVVGWDLDGDPGEDLEDAGDGDPGESFRFLSVLGLASFFMMFGLVGLALNRQSLVGAGWSILGGLAAGLLAIGLMARLFRFASRLQSSGNLDPQAAVQCLGTVCLTIPAGGTGRVNVRIGKRLREMDAMHVSGQELPTGTSVRVLRVERSLAVVQPLTPEASCLPN
jgi:membrane protein implicated in regulation of membrane protease activity